MSFGVFVASTASVAPVTAPEPKLSPNELRRQRGLAIAALCLIRPEGKDNRYRVPSQTGKAGYLVSIDKKKGPHWQCTCKDFEARNEPCKHVYAVRFMIDREKGPEVAADASETTREPIPESIPKPLTLADRVTMAPKTVAPRPTYKQNWPAYNAAQMNEKPKFLALLHDLCKIIEEAPQEGAGRPRVPLRDIVFGAVYKVYSTLSGRRFTGDLMAAEAKGYISRVPHYNTVAKYLEMDGLAPILQALIERSALPLRAVETDFIVDSSGFSSSKFVRWFDEKYGVVKREHDWVKVHIICGVKTNVVTAARIGRQYAADCPQFIPLLKATAEAFTVRECSADSAYCSYDNFDAVAECGGTPYIAFKANATGASGGTYEKMFHLFNFNKEDYTAHYHKRSNIESTFSAVKAKFGDAVRSRTDAAMRNEALCKLLAFNMTCVIQATYELGIEATFFGADAEPKTPPTPDQSPQSGAAVRPGRFEDVSLEDELAAMAWI